VYYLNLPLTNNTLEVSKILIGLANISDLNSIDYVKEMIELKIHLLIIHCSLEWTPLIIQNALRVIGNMSIFDSNSTYSFCKVRIPLIYKINNKGISWSGDS